MTGSRRLVIEVRGISKAFGTTPALIDVDLVAEAGQVLALLGPNGAGKTTLVRILTTLLQPDDGWAEVAGLDVVRDAARVRTVIGLTGQFAAVDLLLTGSENLEMVGGSATYLVTRSRPAPASCSISSIWLAWRGNWLGLTPEACGAASTSQPA